MGFFGKLFEKKECAICGGEIGLLGNRKLEDGNCCKNCASKLSPWFSDRRKSTVEDIKAQLVYREENQQKVASFHTTRTIGRNTKVLLDEDARRFMVTAARNLAEANPDVLDFSQVTGCDLDVQEQEIEEKREVKDKDGHTQRVSYNPPRYRYSYDFQMNIRVNHPYFNDMSFKLNNMSVEIRDMNTMNRMGSYNGMGMRSSNIQGNILNSVIRGIAGAALQNSGDPRMMNHDFAEYYNMGMEIREALTAIRQETRDSIAAENAPKTAVTCPYCGATTTPNAAGCCEFCGGAINA